MRQIAISLLCFLFLYDLLYLYLSWLDKSGIIGLGTLSYNHWGDNSTMHEMNFKDWNNMLSIFVLCTAL